MKKFRNKFLTTCFILSVLTATMGLASCGDNGDNSSPDDSSTAPHQHAWKVDSVIEEATCTQGGKAKYVCECGESKTSTLPPNGHDMPETGTILQPTNCDKEGLEEFECTVCHEKMTVPIPMPDHIYGDPEVTVEPGCFTYGEKTYTCVNCPDFYTEQIDPTGHADADYDGDCDGCKEFVGVQKLALGDSVAPDSGPWHDAPGTFVWYNYDVDKKPAEEQHVVTVTNEKEHTEGNKSIKFDFTNASEVLPGYDVGAYILHIAIDNLEFGANYTLSFYAWASENFNGNLNKMLNNNNFGNGASCVDVNYERVYSAEELAGKGWVKVTATFRANWDRLYKSRCAFRLAFDMPQKWNGELYLADFEVANTNYLLVQEGEKPIENKYIVEKDGRYTIEEGGVILSGCGIQQEAGSENGKAIGGTAAGIPATMTYNIKATEATSGELYLRLACGMDNRPESLKLNQNYMITINGVEIEVADTALNGTLGWANYFDYYAGEINFVKGNNVVEINYLGICPHNLDNLKLVLGETVNEKIYDVYETDGEYIIQDEKAALLNCTKNAEAGTSDGTAIGGMSIGNEASMTFRITSEKAQNVTLFLRASTGMDIRPEDLTMAKNYAITVNGTAIAVADTAMKDPLGWANYYEYLAGKCDLIAGENVIEIKFLGTCNYNIDYLKVVVGEIKVNYDVKAEVGEYVIQDEKAALESCVRNAEAGTSDGYAIGGMSIGNEAKMTFKFTAENAGQAKLYFVASTGMSARPEGLTMAQNYVIIVNGTAITVADTAMNDALGWANYYEYLAGNINLVEGENTIEIKFLGTCNYNIDCLKVVIE